MRITKKLVREMINNCWKRGYLNRNFAVPSYIFTNEQIKKYLDNIKIEFKNSNSYIATMSCTGKRNNFKFSLTIFSDNVDNLNDLDDTIAHELSHFIDFCTERDANHDFLFLHNTLLLSRKSLDCHDQLCEFTSLYMKPKFKKYDKIIREEYL